MKKRNLILALVMAVTMLFTACGSEEPNPFVGKWTGTIDLTDYIVEEMVAEDESMKEFAKFENLNFTLVFEFTEEEISLHVDEASAQQFVANVETGVTNMMDAMVADMAAEYSMTAEDIYAGMGVTREAFIQSTIDSMHLDSLVSGMAESLELKGTYDYDKEKIVVYYEDDTYEEMKYTKGAEDLTITVSDGSNQFVINCQKSN